MSWNQDLRCTSQEANPNPIHLFKILLPNRVVFHYITQIIISDFKDFRMKYLWKQKPDSSSFYAIQPFIQIKVNQQRLFKKCSQSKEFILTLKISPTGHFLYLLLQFRFKETIVSHSLERYEWDRWGLCCCLSILNFLTMTSFIWNVTLI